VNAPRPVTPASILERLQQDVEGLALRGNADAAYQAATGLALGKQLLQVIQQREHVIAALQAELTARATPAAPLSPDVAAPDGATKDAAAETPAKE